MGRDMDITGVLLRRELAFATALALHAGKRVLRHRKAPIEVEHKEQGEVVTAADREANDTIRREILEAFPGDAIYSEETLDSRNRLFHSRVWIVDPIDGTSDFIAGGDHFSVSIGLALDGRPVLGAIYNPARDELFAGAVGLGATRNGSPVVASDAEDLARARITVSKKEHAQLSELVPDVALTPMTSMAYKLARVAAGLDDGVLSRKRRKEWGACAGAALVVAAGGRATLLDGSEIRFNRTELKQPLGMVAAGSRLHSQLVHKVRHLLDVTPGE
ncbi:MAG TPA: 3'(2'),5'-bisphosphate nucleotidase CysQ, partial [Usitatibacter sp.]|nr:3'(2'),5'-bisphosphate nucleotidase CysQ [Usitatibacter sp.]